MKDKTISIIIILLLALFIIYLSFIKKPPIVLNVITPTMLEIDLNDNGLTDENEIFCIPDTETFTANTRFNQEPTAKKLNLSSAEAIAIGYLSDNFAKNLLEGNEVVLKTTKIVTPDCRYANITINKENYAGILNNNGYTLSDNKPVNPEKFNQIKEIAKSLKLAILNHKSLKYHTLDCEYGKVAEDSIIIQEKEIPKDALPCKFCHIEEDNHKNYKAKENPIQNLYNRPTIATDGSIRLILTDFTNTLKPDRNCKNEVCKELVQNINNAKDTIDIAAYGLADIPAVTAALNKAKERLVQIRVVYDTNSKHENYYTETDEILKSYPNKRSDEIFNLPKLTNMLMHNKFVIFDKEKVYTGSMNFSTTGLSGFNHNAIVIINSKYIAQLYTNEFEQMYNGKFHTLKQKTQNNKNIQLGQNIISVYFSPQDKAFSSEVTALIRHSKSYVYMPAFIITFNGIKNELINAKSRGVDVKIITDATNTYARHSAFRELRNHGVPVKVENFAGKIHSKTIIIDDEYLILGSANFSNSAENKNDENLLIIKSPKLASTYKNFFLYLWHKIPDKYLKMTVRAESKDSLGSCNDEIDNDYDGMIDNDDDGCK